MFTKATKQEAYLRLAVIGPAGSGKTYTAMEIASGLVPMGKIAVMDTENGSAAKYSDIFQFDAATLRGDYAPQRYTDAISAAEKAGYEVLIIDSLSHAWMGVGGALEMVDKASARSKSGNSYAAWREVTPHHNRLVDAILSAKIHVIATLRTKTEYVIESNERGKQAPRKVGLAPIQRDGLDYEFDVVLDIDRDHTAVVDKTRCSAIADQVYPMVSASGPLVSALREWLRGEPVVDVVDDSSQAAPPPPPPPTSEKETLIQKAWAIAQAWNADASDWKAAFLGKGFESSKAAPIDYVKNLHASLDAKSGLLQNLEAHSGTSFTTQFLAERDGIMNINLEDIRDTLTAVTGETL
jgi:hypothetical protein